MKKRLLSTLLALCMVLALLPGTALAIKDDDDVAYKVTGGNIYFNKATGSITGYDRGVRVAEIPSEIDGVPVTSIGNSAFEDCYGLTSVVIPDSVTSIGALAFGDCSNLTNVVIPDSVTTIGSWAFSDCRSLTSVVIPGSVTSIEFDTFCGCSRLTSLVIPTSVTSIDVAAFSECSSLVSVVIPDGVTTIEVNTFSGCSSLTSVIIPDSVTTIGNWAFDSCSSLISVDIPDSVTSIGYGAFSNCSSLTNVDIPDSVTSIGYGAFSNCSSLTNVDIPDNVTSIGYGAFSYCSSLTNVDIPDNVTTIGDLVFIGCSKLTSVNIPESVSSIGKGAFASCSALAAIEVSEANPYYTSSDGGLIDQWQKAFIACPAGKQGSYQVPEGITSIGDDAFNGCSGLTSVVIPSSVTFIGDVAFRDCNNLKYVYYSGTEAQWNAISIGYDNDLLKNAEVIFNSTGPDIPAPPAACTVTFIDEHTGAQLGTRQLQKGAALGAMPSVPAHEGYAFQGWYDASGKTVTASTRVTGNMTVYARYEQAGSSSTEITLDIDFEHMVFDTANGTVTVNVTVYMGATLVTVIPVTISIA